MRILLTAFEPFGSSATNITQEVIRELPEQIGEHPLLKLVLPVSFHRAPVVLRQAIEQQKPDFVLMLGQCKDSDSIRLERYAHNMMDSQNGDNDGECPKEQLIYPQSSLALTATTPRVLSAYHDECIQESLPVTISTSAGLYVCNRVYYEALYRGQKALFVHIPQTMSIELVQKIIQKLLSGLVK